MAPLILPDADGTLSAVQLAAPAALVVASTPPSSRIVYAAAHVVADPLRACDAVAGVDQIDWDATVELRRRLWSLGLGVAESMDTAQRGMGLDWAGARELALRTLADARDRGGQVVVGVATDQISSDSPGLDEIRDAYLEQISDIEGAGGSVVMMASRHLARVARSPDDYARVYGEVLEHATRPVILHWLGSMFDPALAGYWGHDEPKAAMAGVVDIIGAHVDKVSGIKVSLLDAALETLLREMIPAPARVFTGDDFNYVDLVAGDGTRHSDALLGAFAAVPRFASAAFARLDVGDVDGFRDILEPTLPLSRLVFSAPTQYYKVGVAWLTYLDGGQDHFRMLRGFETGRSLLHLAELVRVAGSIGLFADPDLAARRASAYFAVQGIG
ncbi:dihydrodipicolinate synthase family protein [Mycobacterium sp. MS1601]|uniref:dihydrodipicolinate synthase family protein n=1 Tax=Mycobacterium sp. MS1601 TaxID=1936029 RepID=UPI0009794482|nr:dihydrodipicolinate synthase family protein [Mycobacterium sp. MS1601]AQA02461.1 dihydrodipicolinate synthase family protein [Mycobacterium sp. MS1601]